MKVQISTDGNIRGHEQMTDKVKWEVEEALSSISDRITRVEVHLSDTGGRKHSVHDTRCVMEARLRGRSPIAVTHKAAILGQAVDGAVDKLTRKLESTLGKLIAQRSRRTDPPEPAL